VIVENVKGLVMKKMHHGGVHMSWSKIQSMLKFLSIVVLQATFCFGAEHKSVASWAVVGAGPGGIITIGVLKDVGVDLSSVLWLDPEFQVGRMGKYYGSVPANNKAKRLVEFLSMCQAFSEVDTPSIATLKGLDPEKEYPLQYIVNPLQDITNHFLKKVSGIKSVVTSLDFKDGVWHISAGDTVYYAERVMLALGSHPRSLGYDAQHEIPLDIALNRTLLAQQVSAQDTVAVVGGAHSAVLVMKFLYELGVGRIINFYRHPLYYLSKEEQQQRVCEVYGDPLSGIAAEWAREVLDVAPPGNLIRLKMSPESLRAWLPLCDKIIYAAGYERNEMPHISGIALNSYDATTGIIGPHLFGIGIAFPEFVDKGDGRCSYSIGVRDFVRFAQRMMPVWLTKHGGLDQFYAPYDDLFEVTVF